MERDPLMLNQRLMLMLTMDTTDMPDHMPMDTEPMVMDTQDLDTMARDLPMPSPRPRLTQLFYTTSHVVNPVTSYVAGSVAPLVYNTHPVTSVNNVPVVNTVYNAAVHTPVVKTVATTPVVYNTAVHTPLVNTVYNTLPLTHSLVNAVPAATTTVSKREAE